MRQLLVMAPHLLQLAYVEAGVCAFSPHGRGARRNRSRVAFAVRIGAQRGIQSAAAFVELMKRFAGFATFI